MACEQVWFLSTVRILFAFSQTKVRSLRKQNSLSIEIPLPHQRKVYKQLFSSLSMKKGVQRFALLLLALYIVSFMSLSFVSAVDPAPGSTSEVGGSDTLTDSARSAVATGVQKTTTLGERLFGVFKNTGGISKDTQLLLTKLLLIFLVVIIVYAIATFLPFFPPAQPGIRWVFAIIIGILAFIFVKPEEIEVLLKTYEALGIALTTIIPLVILLTFTYELQQNSPGIAIIVNKVVLIIFFGYLLFQWVTLEVPVNKDAPALAWLYPICAVITLFWLLGEGYFSKKIKKAEIKAEQEKAEEATDDAIGGLKLLRKVKKGAANISKQEDQMWKERGK